MLKNVFGDLRSTLLGLILASGQAFATLGTHTPWTWKTVIPVLVPAILGGVMHTNPDNKQ